MMGTEIKYSLENGTYTLINSCAIHCPTVDFGQWKAYGVNEWDGIPFIEANGHDFFVYGGYSWDGCTGVPTCKWNLRASLFHDAMYQAKKCGAKTAEWWEIDKIFDTIMSQDGASWLQRKIYYAGVRSFGAFWKCNTLDSLKIVYGNGREY